MKTTLLTICLLFALFVNLNAQKKDSVSVYKTYIYSDPKVGKLIQEAYEKKQENPDSTSSQRIGYVGGTILKTLDVFTDSFITETVGLSVNLLTSLLTKNAADKLKWEEMVKAENVYQETITTLKPLNDFYSVTSEFGTLDPDGMNFYGIGCLRTIGGDTVFYISCHIDTSKIDRIINHSKFELSLDTLIIDPYRCNLPNSNFDTTGFSFDSRKDLQFVIEMRLISSWMTITPMLQKEQELGRFNLSISVNKDDLKGQNRLYYARNDDAPENKKYKIAGESFMVPRSAMQIWNVNEEGKEVLSYIYGTGDYKIELVLKETCNITKEYAENWKKDLKNRQRAINKGTYVPLTVKSVSTQEEIWEKAKDSVKKTVITTIKTPFDITESELKQISQLYKE